ncbi:MAG: phage tail protein [Chloroflexi bacterium]|nr:MAG: phage tail protein [Chloroflexota bacterium]
MPVAVSHSWLRFEPVPAYHYLLLVEKLVWGWFTECGNITLERSVLDYPEGGVNHYVHALPGRVSHSRVTLKHGLAGRFLWDWFQEGASNGQVDRRPISIIVYDALFIPVMWWNLLNAYPVRWVGPALNSAGGEALVEEVEFAYDGGSGAVPSSATVQTKPQEGADSLQPQDIAELSDIDLLTLARKVYRLLKEDLRVDHERRGYKRR